MKLTSPTKSPPILALPASAERVESIVVFDGTPTSTVWLKDYTGRSQGDKYHEDNV